MRTLVCQKYPTEGGLELAADVYLPEGPGPFPVILARTPYDRVGHLGKWAKQFVERDYCFVATDCRGRFESDGVFTKPFEEAVDGAATVNWIAEQKWCNGRIGMWGAVTAGSFRCPRLSVDTKRSGAFAPPSSAPGSSRTGAGTMAVSRSAIRSGGSSARGTAGRPHRPHTSTTRSFTA